MKEKENITDKMEIKENQKSDGKEENSSFTLCLSVGMCLGAGAGALLGYILSGLRLEYIGIGGCYGISIGICLGLAVNSLIKSRKNKNDDEK